MTEAVLDADDLAAALVCVYHACELPYRLVMKGDGVSWVSVECVPNLTVEVR